MQQLYDILNETGKILSNPYKVVENANKNKSFNFDLLTQPSEHKLPEGFEIGVFTSSKQEDIPAFLPFAEANGVAFSIEKVSDFAFFNLNCLRQAVFQILFSKEPV